MRFKEYYNFPYSDISQKPMADLNASKKKKEKKVNEKINIPDASYAADMHSDGTMSVQKVMGKPVLIMKSYHKEKDGQDFAKAYGYKVKNYKKTPRGSRMDISEKVELNEKRVAQGNVAISFDVDSFGGKKARIFVKGTGILDIPASQGKNFLAVVKKLRDSDFK